MRSRLEELRAGIDPLTPLYVLIDPMVGEPLPGIGTLDARVDATSLREQAWQRAIVPVELAETVALPAYQHPYFVALQGPDDPLLDLTFDLAEDERVAAQADGLGGQGRAAHRIGGWIQSSMRPEELGERVAAMCRVNTDARTGATYFRIVDRRVLDLLCHIVGSVRITGQFGRLQTWRYIDTCGNLSLLRSSSENVAPFRVPRHEWGRLEQGEMLHRTIAHYLGEVEVVDEAAMQPLYERAENVVSMAKEAARRWPHRFVNSTDEAVWAALCMMYPKIPALSGVTTLLDDQGSDDEPPEPLRYLYMHVKAIAQQAETLPA